MSSNGDAVKRVSPGCEIFSPLCGGQPSDSEKGLSRPLGSDTPSICGLVGTMVPLARQGGALYSYTSHSRPAAGTQLCNRRCGRGPNNSEKGLTCALGRDTPKHVWVCRHYGTTRRVRGCGEHTSFTHYVIVRHFASLCITLQQFTPLCGGGPSASAEA